MHIEVYPKYTRMHEDHLYDKTVVTVAVLRSGTSMIWAMANGAKKLIPASDAGEAVSLYGRLGADDCILAGEIGNAKPQGFILGNSPREFTAKVVSGKTVIMSTNNGTAALTGIGVAKNIILGAIINKTAAAKKAVELGDDVIILCAGEDGEISAADLCGAGAIIDACLTEATKRGIYTDESDMAFVCRQLYKDWRTKSFNISSTKAYKELTLRSAKEDIAFCFTADMTDVVPKYIDGTVVL